MVPLLPGASFTKYRQCPRRDKGTSDELLVRAQRVQSCTTVVTRPTLTRVVELDIRARHAVTSAFDALHPSPGHSTGHVVNGLSFQGHVPLEFIKVP